MLLRNARSALLAEGSAWPELLHRDRIMNWSWHVLFGTSMQATVHSAGGCQCSSRCLPVASLYSGAAQARGSSVGAFVMRACGREREQAAPRGTAACD